MLFDEKEMMELCEKYGIPVVENDGTVLFEEEMTEDFLISEIMNEPYVSYDDNINISSKKYSLNIPLIGGLNSRNEMIDNTSEIKYCSVAKDKYYNNCTSTIDRKSKNAIAA
ncbi:MAG: hypothetical protein IJF03_12085 [Lachnospiraceae bacterium]|nr:hypothetical protein [Lachnospiraceae bacterium]